MVTAELLAAHWRYAWDQTPDEGATFIETLRRLQREAYLRVQAGALTSHSGQGRSTQWAAGNTPDYTPSDSLDCCSQAVELYKRLSLDLDTEDEETIFNAGENGAIAPVTSTRPDFSCLR